jgi:hypothetical protein
MYLVARRDDVMPTLSSFSAALLRCSRGHKKPNFCGRDGKARERWRVYLSYIPRWNATCLVMYVRQHGAALVRQHRSPAFHFGRLAALRSARTMIREGEQVRVYLWAVWSGDASCVSLIYLSALWLKAVAGDQWRPGRCRQDDDGDDGGDHDDDNDSDSDSGWLL